MNNATARDANYADSYSLSFEMLSAFGFEPYTADADPESISRVPSAKFRAVCVNKSGENLLHSFPAPTVYRQFQSSCAGSLWRISRASSAQNCLWLSRIRPCGKSKFVALYCIYSFGGRNSFRFKNMCYIIIKKRIYKNWYIAIGENTRKIILAMAVLKKCL